MKLRIALSASFYNVKAVQALLKTCDRIYTTQFRNLPEICSLFGDEAVRALPDGCNSTVDWIKERELENARSENKEVEFITYGDLLKISRVTDERVAILTEELETNKTLVEALRAEILDLQEDQRRLNYLAMQGQYSHEGGTPTNTWMVTGTGLQTIREVLDKMRLGLDYTPDNRPVAPALYNRVPSPTLALSPQLAAAVTPHHTIDERISGGCETRDPLEQDHSALPAGAHAQEFNGHGG